MKKSIFDKTGPMILPSRIGGGTFHLYLYTFKKTRNNYFVLTRGNFNNSETLLRINSNCVWADVFGSARCDCAEQLHESMRRIIKNNSGVMIHAYNQDGRGLTLKNHVRVYMEQDKGFDTIEADKRCGFAKPDRRDYKEAVLIIKDLAIKNVKLITNNPQKVRALKAAGIKVKLMPIEAVAIDKYNIAQLYMKKKTLNHTLYNFKLDDQEVKKLFKASLKKWSHGEYKGTIWKC